MNFKAFFKDKKITVMGLGLLGRGLGYTKFLAECGAILTVTDLKTKKQLATSLKELKKYNLPAQAGIKFVLGKHDLKDFKNKDMVIKSAGVPLDSIYIKEARKNNIPVEMDVSLFAKLAKEVMIIGVTGTRGKSMATQLIYEILKENEKFLKRKIYLGGNVRGVATLPLLKKVKAHAKAGQAGDILVCELDSWQLQGFGEAKLSPHISVFTSFMPDHMNYYKNSMKDYFADKANIFKYQTKKDILIIRPGMKKLIKKVNGLPAQAGKLIVANPENIAKYKFNLIGEHQKENLACAVEVAKQFKVPDTNIAKAIKNFKGLEGRLQYLKNVKGVQIYNDNNATTPQATIVGLEALGKKKNVILICGGNDKGLELNAFVKALDSYCKAVVTIPGTGTDKLFEQKPALTAAKRGRFKFKIHGTKNLPEAVKVALGESKSGDVILFSPAFSSFAQYNNEYERNDQFIKIIKGLK